MSNLLTKVSHWLPRNICSRIGRLEDIQDDVALIQLNDERLVLITA